MWSCPKLVGPESNGLHWFANVCHDSHFAFEQCHSRNSPVAGIVPPEAHPYWWRWALVYTATPEDRGAAGELPLEQEVYRVCFMCFINGQDLLAAVPTAFLQVGIPGIHWYPMNLHSRNISKQAPFRWHLEVSECVRQKSHVRHTCQTWRRCTNLPRWSQCCRNFLILSRLLATVSARNSLTPCLGAYSPTAPFVAPMLPG